MSAPPGPVDSLNRGTRNRSARAPGSKRRQLPGVTALAVEPLVCIRVVELPFLRAPVQHSTVPVGDVAEDRNRHGPSADLDIGYGPLPRANAVDPPRWWPGEDGRCTSSLLSGSFTIFSRIAREVVAVDPKSSSLPVNVQPLPPP